LSLSGRMCPRCGVPTTQLTWRWIRRETSSPWAPATTGSRYSIPRGSSSGNSVTTDAGADSQVMQWDSAASETYRACVIEARNSPPQIGSGGLLTRFLNPLKLRMVYSGPRAASEALSMASLALFGNHPAVKTGLEAEDRARLRPVSMCGPLYAQKTLETLSCGLSARLSNRLGFAKVPSDWFPVRI